MTQEELSTRDWHVDALTLWGNVNIVTQYINNIEVPQLRWVHRNLTEWHDDERAIVTGKQIGRAHV